MGADQHGDLLLGGDPREQRDDLLGGAQIEIRERLVEQQELRASDQRVGDQHALLLAARELADARVGETLCVHRVQHLVYTRPAGAGWQRDTEPLRVDTQADEVASA